MYLLKCVNLIQYFEPIDTIYPRFDRVAGKIPDSEPEHSIHRQFNWEYVATAYKSIGEWMDIKKGKTIPVKFNISASEGFGYFKVDNALCIVMELLL